MGDRGNIVVKVDDGDIYLYSHCTGSELPIILQNALKKFPGRWEDPSYMARIIFCEMIKDCVGGETGYGISVSISDNEHNILLVNVFDQSISEIDENSVGNTLGNKYKVIKTWSFKEYIALTPETLPKI